MQYVPNVTDGLINVHGITQTVMTGTIMGSMEITAGPVTCSVINHGLVNMQTCMLCKRLRHIVKYLQHWLVSQKNNNNVSCHFSTNDYKNLILSMWAPGLTTSTLWPLMPWLLALSVIRSHDIDRVKQEGPCLTRGRIWTTCVMSVWRNDWSCKYMFMMKKLARKVLSNIFLTRIKHHP